ncbi:pseudaminic acid synthase [Candidatus Magnetaquicoccus inordinatus]|uniref:pseudaminic acid synthase n=1 Tax=Candidatus Magnetaquicoccus inordinatus TaxID=2496818 RepID=UPI00102B8121|nr:pseudaminic acid synthase [Candidatus Magnetaquicoccus inordinatus]
MKPITIADYTIGAEHPPFIIAELSGNHNGSLERAMAIVEAAAQAGAHALKIQTYTADTMTLDLSAGPFRIDNPDSLWQGTSLYQLYQQAYTPWEWHQPLFARCRQLGMAAFSTPFDASAVDFLESLQVPCYKIASFENIDLPLIKKVAATGKPVIISTGMATLAELEESVQTARSAGCQDLLLLKCTSTYPASPMHSNLQSIPTMRTLFDCQIGLSDHTLGIGVAVASVALGATVIEKHFTLARADGGVDAAFSLEPHELRQLVDETGRAWQAMGQVHFGATSSERDSLQFRRSLYITKDLQAGDRLNKDNLRAIRPGLGLPPKFLEWLLDKPVGRAVAKGTPMSLELLWPS